MNGVYRWMIVNFRTRVVPGLLLMSLSFMQLPALGQARLAIPPVPSLSAGSYILVEASTGDVLAERLADARRPPASLTKVMTSYILAGYMHSGLLPEEELVTVSRNAWAQNPVFKGSSLMWIEPAKRVSLLDLYRGMVISSGNDAAVAVAEHVSGSEPGFVKLLNREAKVLGMDNTYFDNAHGLGDLPVAGTTAVMSSEAYTSARDMSMLARAVINHYPRYYDYYAEREFEYNGILQKNRNILLDTFAGADGIKTGYTKAAKFCLMSSAARDNMRLIAVVLNANSEASRLRDSRILLEYGFRYFRVHTLANGGQHLLNARVYGGNLTELPVGVGQDVNVVLPRGVSADVQKLVHVSNRIRAPVTQGDELGVVHYSQGGERLVSAPLVALRSVSGGGLLRRAVDWTYLGIAGFFLVDTAAED